MKQLFTIFAVLFMLQLNATTDYKIKGNENAYLLENVKLDIIVEDDALLSFFTEVNFSEEKDRIKFTSLVTISSIKVLNADNELEYVLPIDGTTLNLSVKDFTKGNYNLEMTFEGDSNVYKTSFNKKY